MKTVGNYKINLSFSVAALKFILFKKATKIDKIFTVNLMLTKGQ